MLQKEDIPASWNSLLQTRSAEKFLINNGHLLWIPGYPYYYGLVFFKVQNPVQSLLEEPSWVGILHIYWLNWKAKVCQPVRQGVRDGAAVSVYMLGLTGMLNIKYEKVSSPFPHCA